MDSSQDNEFLVKCIQEIFGTFSLLLEYDNEEFRFFINYFEDTVLGCYDIPKSAEYGIDKPPEASFTVTKSPNNVEQIRLEFDWTYLKVCGNCCGERAISETISDRLSPNDNEEVKLDIDLINLLKNKINSFNKLEGLFDGILDFIIRRIHRENSTQKFIYSKTDKDIIEQDLMVIKAKFDDRIKSYLLGCADISEYCLMTCNQDYGWSWDDDLPPTPEEEDDTNRKYINLNRLQNRRRDMELIYDPMYQRPEIIEAREKLASPRNSTIKIVNYKNDRILLKNRKTSGFIDRLDFIKSLLN